MKGITFGKKKQPILISKYNQKKKKKKETKKERELTN